MSEFINIDIKPIFNDIPQYDYLKPISLLANYHEEIKPNIYHDILSTVNKSEFNNLLKNKKILPQSDINDLIMIEYIKCFSNNNIIVLYPKALSKKDKLKDFFKLLDENGSVYYTKLLNINYYYAYNLMFQLYANTNRMKSNNQIIYKLTRLGFTFNTNSDILIVVYQHLNINKKINGSSTPFKSELRKVFLNEDLKTTKITNLEDAYPREYDYLHINDTFNETINYSYSFFHKNTIKFTSRQQSWRLLELFDGIKKFNHFIKNIYSKLSLLDQSNLILSSSTVLFAYGIRNMNDIDGIILDNKNIDINTYNIFNTELYDDIYRPAIKKNERWETQLNKRSSVIDVDDFKQLIINPNYHFYFHGVKLFLLKQEILIRIKRQRPAQFTDLLVINRLLNINFKLTIPDTQQIFNKNTDEITTTTYKEDQFVNTVKNYLYDRYQLLLNIDQVKKWIDSTENKITINTPSHNIPIYQSSSITYPNKELYYTIPNISNNPTIFPELSELSKFGFTSYSSILSDDKPYLYYGEDWENNKLCTSTPKEIYNKPNYRLRVLTFNVHNFITRCNQGSAPIFFNNLNQFNKPRNFNNFLELFKKINADVICLQEFVPLLDYELNEDITDYDEIRKINFKYINTEMAKLGYKYSCIGDCIKNNFTINEHRTYHMLCNAIYSKIPIEEEKLFHLFINRNIIGIKIKYNNKYIWILNTHLAYFSDKTLLDLNKETIVLQFETLKQIIQKEFNNKNIIFCGDFNINLYRKGTSYRYKNFDKVKNITDLFNNTSRVVIPTNFSQNDQTDFILLSKSSDLIPKFNLIYNSNISDHNPLFTDFSS